MVGIVPGIGFSNRSMFRRGTACRAPTSGWSSKRWCNGD